jgi:hypothetical protein
MGHGIVLKGIVKYYGRGKNIPHTFGHTEPIHGWEGIIESIAVRLKSLSTVFQVCKKSQNLLREELIYILFRLKNATYL